MDHRQQLDVFPAQAVGHEIAGVPRGFSDNQLTRAVFATGSPQARLFAKLCYHTKDVLSRPFCRIRAVFGDVSDDLFQIGTSARSPDEFHLRRIVLPLGPSVSLAGLGDDRVYAGRYLLVRGELAGIGLP